MTIYDLKPAFQNLLRPLCRKLALAGFTANQVTLVAAVGSIIVGGLFAYVRGTGPVALIVPVWLFARMALNAIDGMLAREHAQQSALGGMLNEIGDVVSDAALYLPFAFVPGISVVLVIAAVFAALLTELAGVVAVQIGADRRYDGPMGKSDRALAFGLGAFLLGSGIQAGPWLDAGLGIVVVLSAVTVVRRASAAVTSATARDPATDDPEARNSH